ncbi:hypothetical protein GCM10010140_60430 [Streptosporangium pseudovulgare]|uniref:Uncharacterized protein n=1 Tax=Streptosporangium pseudovulgare TaxID=35765 RepID=A0ABQ2RAI4_9ACTN|nr:hypothetical protein GCM10010140_60430 [Streptosporangium pseudovulgare]
MELQAAGNPAAAWGVLRLFASPRTPRETFVLRRLLATAAVAGAMLLTPSVAGLAPAADASSAVATACTYQRSGNHWNCVTPGAYCPKAAHGKAGYAKVTGRRYTCARYSNGQWR